MEISRHDDIEKDFRALRRSVAPQESLEAWENEAELIALIKERLN